MIHCLLEQVSSLGQAPVWACILLKPAVNPSLRLWVSLCPESSCTPLVGHYAGLSQPFLSAFPQADAAFQHPPALSRRRHQFSPTLWTHCLLISETEGGKLLYYTDTRYYYYTTVHFFKVMWPLSLCPGTFNTYYRLLLNHPYSQTVI